jgi:hypothetical protein
MPDQVDTPIATGSKSDWGLWRSPSKIAALATDDGNSSIVYAASGGRLLVDLYGFPPISGVTDPVAEASITMRARQYLQGAGGQTLRLAWNGVGVGTNRAAFIGIVKPNYRTATYDAAGAELDLSAVNGEHGMRFRAAGGPSQKSEYWVTHLYRTVTFTYDAGSADAFGHLLGSLAGFAIGAGLLLREMPALSRFMGARGRVWLRPDEYEPAWKAWRAQKRLVVV